MNTKTKTILSLAAIYCLVIIALSSLAYVFNFSQHSYFGWVNLLLVIIMLFFIQKQYKKQVFNNRIKYGQLLSGSFLIILAGSIVVSLYTYIFFKVIAPEQIEELINMSYQELINKGFSDSQIDMQMDLIKKFMTPFSLTITGLFSNILTHTIIALILSIFNKTKADTLNEDVSLDENIENQAN